MPQMPYAPKHHTEIGEVKGLSMGGGGFVQVRRVGRGEANA